jgi:hypothetical protein
MSTPARRAVALGVVIALSLGLLHKLGVGLWLLMATAIAIALIAWAVPWIGVRWLDAVILWARGVFWAREQGRFHSFGDVPLYIADDGYHPWVDADGYMRALGQIEPEAVVAARHAGHWQRDEEQRLMLRVDEVVRVLGTRPGATDPRVQRLRRYFEREVLFPARLRRERAK